MFHRRPVVEATPAGAVVDAGMSGDASVVDASVVDAPVLDATTPDAAVVTDETPRPHTKPRAAKPRIERGSAAPVQPARKCPTNDPLCAFGGEN
jgi:hypothetical protein